VKDKKRSKNKVTVSIILRSKHSTYFCQIFFLENLNAFLLLTNNKFIPKGKNLTTYYFIIRKQHKTINNSFQELFCRILFAIPSFKSSKELSKTHKVFCLIIFF